MNVVRVSAIAGYLAPPEQPDSLNRQREEYAKAMKKKLPPLHRRFGEIRKLDRGEASVCSARRGGTPKSVQRVSSILKNTA